MVIETADSSGNCELLQKGPELMWKTKTINKRVLKVITMPLLKLCGFKAILKRNVMKKAEVRRCMVSNVSA